MTVDHEAAPSASDVVVRIREAGKSIPGGASLFSGANLTVSVGESVAIVGPSGSGKTSLLSAIGLMDSLDEGDLRLLGEDVASLSRRGLDDARSKIGFVFQRFLLIKHLTVLENVLVPLTVRRGASKRDAIEHAKEALRQVGLDSKLQRKPRELSGGEQQRVAIARAIATRPSLICADEPTGSLDDRTSGAIFDVLENYVTGAGVAMIVVTHDRNVAARMHRVYELAGGRLTEAAAAGAQRE